MPSFSRRPHNYRATTGPLFQGTVQFWRTYEVRRGGAVESSKGQLVLDDDKLDLETLILNRLQERKRGQTVDELAEYLRAPRAFVLVALHKLLQNGRVFRDLDGAWRMKRTPQSDVTNLTEQPWKSCAIQLVTSSFCRAMVPHV